MLFDQHEETAPRHLHRLPQVNAASRKAVEKYLPALIRTAERWLGYAECQRESVSQGRPTAAYLRMFVRKLLRIDRAYELVGPLSPPPIYGPLLSLLNRPGASEWPHGLTEDHLRALKNLAADFSARGAQAAPPNSPHTPAADTPDPAPVSIGLAPSNPTTAQTEDLSRWLTVSEAAKTVDVPPGRITHWVDDGVRGKKLASNGESGRSRRIDSHALNRFVLDVARRAESTESVEQVERQVRRHVTDPI